MQKHDGKLFLFAMEVRNCRVQSVITQLLRKSVEFSFVRGFKRFHLYLYGVPFVLQTDHEPLKYMNSVKFANGSLMRWAMFLQAIKGSENVGAD